MEGRVIYNVPCVLNLALIMDIPSFVIISRMPVPSHALSLVRPSVNRISFRRVLK